MAIIPLQMINADKILSFCLPLVTGLILHNFLANKVLKGDSDPSTLQSKLNHMQIWKSSVQFGSISITSAFGNLDGLLVAIVSSASNSGSYILSQRFRNPLTIVFNSVSMRVRTIAAKGDFVQIRRALREDFTLLRLGAIINILVSIFLFMHANEIFGANFSDINIVVCLGTLSSIPLGVILIANTILSSIGDEVLVSRLSLIFLGLLFISVTVFSISSGAVGAVIGSLGVLTCQSLLLAGILNARINPKP
jgi:O-antigen/teichoic acid export membrane protein